MVRYGSKIIVKGLFTTTS